MSLRRIVLVPDLQRWTRQKAEELSDEFLSFFLLSFLFQRTTHYCSRKIILDLIDYG
jgi:hypothetical protein